MKHTLHVRRRGPGVLSAALVTMLVLSSCTSTGGFSDETVPRTDTTEVPDLQPVDGGADYFSNFTDGPPTDRSYFPVGVWIEKVLESSDIQKDQDLNINTYVGVTEDSTLELLDGLDSYALTFWPDDGSQGIIVSDEVDMWAGAGSGEWTGNFPGQGPICEPVDVSCGYSVQEDLTAQASPDGVLRYANYGKGVTFWQSDEQASVFVNRFQDLVSADNYWFTDPNICSEFEGGQMLPEPRQLTQQECRRASNYGWTVDRLRSLVQPSGSLPIWAFIEVGHPFPEPGGATITPPQIRAAVWSSIVHGARGIIYFNHSFSGHCATQHVLRDCGTELTGPVSELNAQLHELAPALNSETALDAASSPASLDLLTKRDGSDIVAIAASTGDDSQESAAIHVRCVADGDAEVLWENRTVPVEDGVIRDDFADANAVHVYRFSGNTCGWS